MRDVVTNFPGQPKVSFRHFSGYVTVNEPSGPGCSSVGYGATQEIGPFLVDNNGTSIKFNPYAWNKEANILGTRYCIDKLELPIKTSWRPWYHEKQVSGWLQEYEGLTFATIKGAGHDVPTFKPSESLAFFSAFLNGSPPPLTR